MNMHWVLNMPKFLKRQCSNMQALHTVLNTPKYSFAKFRIYPEFLVSQNFEYGRVLNMAELHRVLTMPQHGWICQYRLLECLKLSEFTIIDTALNLFITQCIAQGHSTSYWVLIERWVYSEPHQRSTVEHFKK